MVESARHDEDRRRAYEAKRAVNPLPPIVECALQRLKDGEHLEAATEWAWNGADTPARLAVDAWMQVVGHSLVNVPGRERRFRLLVDMEQVTRTHEAENARWAGPTQADCSGPTR